MAISADLIERKSISESMLCLPHRKLLEKVMKRKNVPENKQRDSIVLTGIRNSCDASSFNSFSFSNACFNCLRPFSLWNINGNHYITFHTSWVIEDSSRRYRYGKSCTIFSKNIILFNQR